MAFSERLQRQIITVSSWRDLPLYFLNVLRGWRTWLNLGMNDIKKRFAGTILGLSWPFIQMCSILFVIAAVYGVLLFRQKVDFFVPYLAAGLTMWHYLSRAIDRGCMSLVASEGYIKQVSQPKALYALRFMVSAFYEFSMSLLAFLIIKVAFKSPYSWGMLWAIPGIALFTILVTCWALIFSYLNARFRDIQHVVMVVLQAFFYVTPIIYPVQMLEDRGWGIIAYANPVYHMLQIVRAPLIDGSIPSLLTFGMVLGLIGLSFSLLCLLLVKMDRKIVFYL